MPVFHHSLVLPNAVQVRLHWDFNGHKGFNVLGGSVAGGFANSQAIANALGTAVLGHFTSSGLAALCHSTTSLLATGIRDIRNPNLAEFVSVAAAVPGTGGGDPLPEQVAAVVTLRTALAGKHFRGRTYFGGFNEAQNDATGKMAAGLQTALESFMTDVQTDLTAQGITLAVLSRPKWDPLVELIPIYAGAVTPVTAVTVRDLQWDTQRRRRGK